ncbi:MAG TPA: hypothetical protein VN783_09750 [Thermoanaerobaculia bacterium]|nr:hypothetical protein [Thermoanaerobaculia bacterium]
MRLLTFSYVLSLMGAYLLAPHIMPEVFLRRVEKLTGLFEGWARSLEEQVHDRLRRMIASVTLKEWSENIGWGGAMIGLVALVSSFGWVVQKIPLLGRPNGLAGALYLLWCSSFKVTDLLLDNKHALAGWFWPLALICSPLIATAFLSRLPLILILRALPLVWLASIIGPVFVLHIALSGQLQIAAWSKRTTPQKLLGYCGFLILTFSVIVQIFYSEP